MSQRTSDMPTPPYSQKSVREAKPKHVREAIDEARGLGTKKVCQNCNHSNPDDAHKCRRCDSKDFRPKRAKHSENKYGVGSENSGR